LDGRYRSAERGIQENQNVKIAGRIMAIRGHGKAAFFDIQDDTGKIQVYIKKDNVSEDTFKLYNLLDIGDIVGLEGKVFKSKRGEISVSIDTMMLLAKSLRPLPEKWHGLKDTELRYRQRYLDLIVNPEAGFFWRFKSDWSVGAHLGLNIMPQWYGNKDYNRTGYFLDTGLSVRYHF